MYQIQKGNLNKRILPKSQMINKIPNQQKRPNQTKKILLKKSQKIKTNRNKSHRRKKKEKIRKIKKISNQNTATTVPPSPIPKTSPLG